ncbi:MAG TPA: hypothetical protein VFB50_04490 [Chloroflexota bacterium]|nr:hypothetical protein [Chloroflexota bacterium]
MNRLLEIVQSPERFARFTKRVSLGTIVGFVAVVGLLLVQVLSR